MVTKQEVAGRAGVSTATVGRVISGKGYVSAEARAKVNAAVKELNYRANKLASNLRKSKSNIIAVLVSRQAHVPSSHLRQTHTFQDFSRTNLSLK